MKTLLELLGQELHDQVVSKLGDTQIFLHEKDQKVLIDDGKLIPHYRIEEITHQKGELAKQLEKAEKDLKELKKLSVGNEDLTQRITALQDENKAIKESSAKAELQMKKALAVKEELMNAGVLDPDARDLLLPRFDLETLELTDQGKVKDFDGKLKPLKEHKALSQLFGEVKVAGRSPIDPPSPTGTYTREQVEKMTQKEVIDNYDAVQKSMATWDVSQ